MSYSNELEIRIGDPKVVDPIIINLTEGTLNFRNETFEFDLNIDGEKEQIPYFDGNFAYLALDLNANEKIDDGQELFGPKTGHGFSELGKYDEDKNGWIDEKDSIFNSLKLWIPEGDNNFKLLQLKEKNIGAIYLNTVDSFFEISKDTRSMGIIKKAGLYLKESGNVGQVFEIDILV